MDTGQFRGCVVVMEGVTEVSTGQGRGDGMEGSSRAERTHSTGDDCMRERVTGKL